jgi:starch phosphorylase
MATTTEVFRDDHLPTLEDINRSVSEKGDPAETLANLVRFIQAHFKVDVCSIYLIKPDRQNLVLAATVGLRLQSVGRVEMSLKEGLTGLVAEELRPIMVADAPRHPRFKYFPDAGEEPYHSFLGVPLIDRSLLQGVLIVQTADPREFSSQEVGMLLSIAREVSPLVSEARTLEQFIAPVHERFWDLARNLWWSWDAEVESVFRELDPDRWRELGHNPVALLAELSLEQLDRRAGKHELHSRINHAYRRQQSYLHSSRTWATTHAGVLRARPVAYFSAEFGLHESLPIYSGGLGVLAGDHIKSASDLGVPLVGIGLYYDQGYFRQWLDADGWQREEYLDTDVKLLPLELALGRDDRPLLVRIDTRSGGISARVWKVAVGRNTLLLLDSDVDGNAPEDRELTARLYGGDQRTRIRQELLLGVGGVRALRALNIHPGVLHLNEGHSAFAVLETIRGRMQGEGLSFDVAQRQVREHVVFTTHTPVPAGHDRFPPGLVEEHLGPLREAIGMSQERFMELGRVNPSNHHEDFCMTVLALKNARRVNAVSALHGQVSRRMWTELYHGRAEEAVPIGHITNGVHALSWLAPEMRRLYDRHLIPGWEEHGGEAHVWERVDSLDDGELWETHQVLKARLLTFVRQRSVQQAERRGESRDTLALLRRALSLDVLTIGFARRFATYKRANLVFRFLDQMADLVNDPQFPIQFVFAGKAHPRDEPGKRVLQEIAALVRQSRFAGKVVFVEDYDIRVARHLVQGVDVWLNNPRRPLEASGTSGQKIVLNGGLNLSILDGWWAEAYDASNGFAIGMGEMHSSPDTHDEQDARALYRVLREEVIPLYYKRDRDGLPRAWIERMKWAIRTLGWRFNADRMVMDYVLKCYLPAAGGVSSDMG